MTEKVFSSTPRFNQAVELINEVDGSKFPKLLSRIVEKLHVKGEKAFTDDELNKLQASLGMNVADLSLLVETAEFILQQAAYFGMKPDALQEQLESRGIKDDKSEIISRIWAAYGKGVIDKLRKQSFSQKQLESVDWDLNLQLAQATKTQMKNTNAKFHLNLSNNETGKTERLLLEFSHEELLQFYNKLEVVQNQLDSLS